MGDRIRVVAFLLITVSCASSFVQSGVIANQEYRTPPGPARNFAPPGTESHVVMLGTGNPLPNPNRYGPATAIIVNGQPYIVDAGEGIWRALANAATTHGGKIATAFHPNSLTRLFITHIHADHNIGIPSLLMMPWYLGRTNSMEIYGPVGIEHLVENVIEAWQPDVRAQSAVGGVGNNGWNASAHDLNIPLSKIVYQDSNVKVEAFHHHHVNLTNNYAYRFTTPDRVIVIGGDGTGDPAMIEAAKNADVFIMEVNTEADLVNAPWGGTTLAEKEAMIWQYHIKPRELAEIASKAGVKRLVLYHVQNYSDPYDPDALLKEIKEFYKGEVNLARDADIF
jgi:ribonuclease Z